MNVPGRRPFEGMTREKWLNLAIASVLGFYLFYIAWEMGLRTLCGQIAVDYCAYRSAGTVANVHGYARVYDLQLMDQAEKSILPKTADPARFGTVPFPYLPVFVLPFQVLCLLSPEAGYGIWSAVNIIALFFYLRFFARALNGRPPGTRLMLMIFASLPVYLSIWGGQIDVWLAICVGEFTRALLSGKPFRAGLWLGGLLLKPQLLVLIGLLFVLQRSLRILAGLATCSAILVISSLTLIGPSGMVQMLRLWLIYASGHTSSWIEGMTNWRMLGFHLSAIIDPWIGWGIATAGMLATLVIALLVWRPPFSPTRALSPIAILGVLAATTSFAWHSHISMATILIPPIVYLSLSNVLPQRALEYWVFLPAILFIFVVFAPEALAEFNIWNEGGRRLIYFFIGGAEFAVNLYLFGWAVRRTRQAN